MLEDSQTSRPPSPAETLRRAAGQVRTDWPTCGCDECSDSYALSAAFHRAVADLLDALALDRELDPYLTKHFDEPALKAARAYLGESA